MRKLSPADYHYLYELTAQVTPLPDDCGLLCGSICCRQNGEDTLGVYLFPGEEVMFSGREKWLAWEIQDRDEQSFPASWPQEIYFVRCLDFCARELRPLACRFFPLAPHFTDNGELLLIYETLPLPYRCPLITNKIPLQHEFIQVVARSWQVLLFDKRIWDLVEEDTRERRCEGKQIEVVWQSEKSARKQRPGSEII